MDLPKTAERVIDACKPSGKIIFYIYRDVLRILRIVYLMRFKWVSRVGDLLPRKMKNDLQRIDHKEVSIGVYRKRCD